MIIKSAQKISEQAQTIAKLEIERDDWRDKFKLIERELDKFRHGGNGRTH